MKEETLSNSIDWEKSNQNKNTLLLNTYST